MSFTVSYPVPAHFTFPFIGGFGTGFAVRPRKLSSSTRSVMTCPARRSAWVAGSSTRRETGTVLMLMPAAVLVLLVLGGITFDYAHLYLAKRELTVRGEPQPTTP